MNVNLKDLALKVATEAHAGQFDKSGVPYIEHPKTVAAIFENDEIRYIVALLHDVVEDTNITLDDLRKMGFPEEVIEAVDILTKRKGEDYFQVYLKRVKQNSTTRDVKISDVYHNSMLSRLKTITGQDRRRHEKYVKAFAYLMKEE